MTKGPDENQDPLSFITQADCQIFLAKIPPAAILIDLYLQHPG